MINGKISFYCRMLGINRQGFYKSLSNKGRTWKYQDLANDTKEIIREDACNDTYGRIWIYQALLPKQSKGVHIPIERTVYRVMDQIGLSHRPVRKPNALTQRRPEAMKPIHLPYLLYPVPCSYWASSWYADLPVYDTLNLPKKSVRIP